MMLPSVIVLQRAVESCLPDEEASSFRGRHLHHQNITIHMFVHRSTTICQGGLLGLTVTRCVTERKWEKGQQQTFSIMKKTIFSSLKKLGK